MNSYRLQDFLITHPARTGTCGNAGSFQVVHKLHNWPALLHRFKPIDVLPAKQIRLENTPDFTRPFLSRFTGILQTHGSLYLIEPLPNIISLIEVWREILWKCPEIAVNAILECISQIESILKEHPDMIKRLDASLVVLTTPGIWGILNPVLHTPFQEIPVRAMYPLSIPEVLWTIEKTVSQTRSKPILTPHQHDQIHNGINHLYFRYSMERTKI